MSDNSNVSKKLVLAIDEMPDILHSIIVSLEADFNVCGLTSSSTALEFLKNYIPDIIILDMAEKDGCRLLETIRATKEYQHIPVLILSSDATIETILRANNFGAVDFLAKPVDKKMLLTKAKSF